MADRRPASEKPAGAGKPNRINRLLMEQALKSYGSGAGVIALGNRGLNSEQTLEMRAQMRAKGLRLRVVRNRITLRAFRQLGAQQADTLFSGPTALIDAEDPVAAAKLALEFTQKFAKKMVVLGGVVEGKVLTPPEVETLSQSKSKPELLAELAGLIRGPGSQLAAALLGPGGRLAGAVKAVVEKCEKEAAAQAAPAAEAKST